jgi:hypothetical protein
MSTTRAKITIAVRDDLAESHAGHVVPMFIAKLAYMLKKETRCVGSSKELFLRHSW